MNKSIFVSGLAILLVTFTACGGQETPTSVQEPEARPTEAPTESPTEVPTVQPTEAPVEKPTPAAVAVNEGATPEDITGIVWLWESFQDTAGQNDIQVEEPNRYTLTLLPNGQASIKADCNIVNKDYTVEGNSIEFSEIGISTNAMCPPDSLEQVFLELLAFGRTWVMTENGNLVLNQVADGGNLIFSNGGQADLPDEVIGDALFEEVQNTTWLWSDLVETEHQSVVPDPQDYTVNFQPDGTAIIKADCNQVSWTYIQEGNNLTFITLGPSTLAFCGEDSLDQLYLASLERTATWSIEDGRLKLSLAENAGTIGFNQGSAIDSAGGVGFDPSQINLDAQGLAETWEAHVIPTKAYDKSQPPGPMGLPEHIEITFNGTDPASRELLDPVLYVIPVNAYRAMWEANGNDSISQTMDQVFDLTAVITSPPPTSGLPALPPEAGIVGFNDLATQSGRASSDENSASKNGYRFTGRWAQDANLVTNQGLRYVYQGFTNDGIFLVSFFYPVSSTQLPNDVGDTPQEDMDNFNSDATAYINEKAEQLNQLSTSDWEPDLATLDALVGSLQIEGIPNSGLQDVEWQWVATRASTDPDDQMALVENPELYEVIYHSDLTINVKADCNNSSGTYQLNGPSNGAIGGMLTNLGLATLAECGQDSRSQDMLDLVQASQEYRVKPGGETLELLMPAGGPVHILRKTGDSESSGSSTSGDASITGTVTYRQRSALPRDAVVQVQIQDVSLADAPATVIGEQIIETGGQQVPIPYEVFYNSSDIQENHEYAMSARITDGDGNLLFINDTRIPVITRGNPTQDVEIIVVPVSG